MLDLLLGSSKSGYLFLIMVFNLAWCCEPELQCVHIVSCLVLIVIILGTRWRLSKIRFDVPQDLCASIIMLRLNEIVQGINRVRIVSVSQP